MQQVTAQMMAGSPVSADLSRTLSMPVHRMLAQGFVLDTSAVSAAAVIEANDHNEMLRRQTKLSGQMIAELPLFEERIREQERRARNVPVDLARENQRAAKAGGLLDADGLHARNADLAVEHDALHAAAEEREAQLAELRQQLYQTNEEATGGAIAGRYHDSRLHSMGGILAQIETAHALQEQESATLHHMLARLGVEARQCTDRADRVKAARAQIERESARLLRSQ